MLFFFQATFLPSLYEENFLWKSLLIAVVAVGSLSQTVQCKWSLCLLIKRVEPPAAVPPVHPAAVPAALDGDQVRRPHHEAGPVLQVRLNSYVPRPCSARRAI